MSTNRSQVLCLLLCITLGIFAPAMAQDCIQAPQNPDCANFRFPGSEDVVTEFCSDMGNMPGCTIYSTCQNAAYNASTHGNGVCTYFSLAVDLCADMPGMNRAACNNLTSMCHPTTGTTQVLECQTRDLVATLPTFMQSKSAVTALCATNPPSQGVCNECTENRFQCDLLTNFVKLCSMAPERSECDRAKTFCQSVQAYGWPVCEPMATQPAVPTMPPMHMHPTPVPTSAPNGQLDCPRQPTNPSCADYRIANPGGVVKEMCDMMDNMPACSVKNRVCTQKKFSSSDYCSDSSLMADVCTDMTMGVTGCVDYQDMCVAGSVVRECSEPSLKSVLPTYAEAKSYVNSICSSMSMAGCETCKGGTSGTSCDYLTVYSELCMAMPGMTQCTAWSTLCKTVPTWPYCSMEEAGVPEMRMYFHAGIVDYVLFKGWVPRNGVQYAFTWLGIALAGVLLEALKFLRGKLEKYWTESTHGYVSLNGSDFDTVHPSSHATHAPWSWKVDLPRAALATLELGWGYLLMLVAMTFNVGLFFAVLFGCFLGTVIFGRFLVTLPKQKTQSCH